MVFGEGRSFPEELRSVPERSPSETNLASASVGLFVCRFVAGLRNINMATVSLFRDTKTAVAGDILEELVGMRIK